VDLALVERLICPRAHEPAPLVVRADEVVEGRLLRGVVGCPVCSGEWPVAAGRVQFGATTAGTAADVGDAETIAALLALSEPGRVVVVDGASPELVAALVDQFGATVVALDARPGTHAAAEISGAERVPLAPGAARAVLMLRPSREELFVTSAVRALAPGGRMVGAAAVKTPSDVRELARDERLWVGERERVTAPVPLRRAGA
jgi:hypothetical protein